MKISKLKRNICILMVCIFFFIISCSRKESCDFVIKNVNLFNGEKVIKIATIYVKEGLIVRVNPAKAFKLKDKGVIREGVSADFVLVAGNLLSDISKLNSIAAVFKNGISISSTVNGSTNLMIWSFVNCSLFFHVSGKKSSISGRDCRPEDNYFIVFLCFVYFF